MICATVFVGKMEVELLKEQGGDREILHQFKLLLCDFRGSVCSVHYCTSQKMLQKTRMADTHYC